MSQAVSPPGLHQWLVKINKTCRASERARARLAASSAKVYTMRPSATEADAWLGLCISTRLPLLARLSFSRNRHASRRKHVQLTRASCKSIPCTPPLPAPCVPGCLENACCLCFCSRSSACSSFGTPVFRHGGQRPLAYKACKLGLAEVCNRQTDPGGCFPLTSMQCGTFLSHGSIETHRHRGAHRQTQATSSMLPNALFVWPSSTTPSSTTPRSL